MTSCGYMRLKMIHNEPLVACERLCIPFDGNKMADEEEPSLGFF